jgi:hypothetical protein
MKRCEQCGQKPERGIRKRGIDVRDAVAVLVVVFTFGLAGIRAFKGAAPPLVDPWVAGALQGVLSMYFIGRIGERMREITRENAEKSGSKEKSR